MFFVAFLDSQPRLRLSDDHLKSILWVMKECGTPNVPSFSALRKVQAHLKSTVGPASARHVSTLGNEFYMNSAAQIFRLVSITSVRIQYTINKTYVLNRTLQTLLSVRTFIPI